MNKPDCFSYYIECPKHEVIGLCKHIRHCDIQEECRKAWYDAGGLLGYEDIVNAKKEDKT